MTANEQQVGGKHYSTGFHHWDLIELHGIGYLEGYATKYLVRLEAKGNVREDLKKAKHCVEKLIELATSNERFSRGSVPNAVMGEFFAANDIWEHNQREAIRLLCSAWTVTDLHNATYHIRAMLEKLPDEPHIDNTGQERPFGFDAAEEEGR